MSRSLSANDRVILEMLAQGAASLSGQTRSDLPNGIHTVRSVDVGPLIGEGYVRHVGAGWNAVELTDAGREIVAELKRPRMTP